MNVTLAENLFSSSMNFLELDDISLEAAKERFDKFKKTGVITGNCVFEDEIWYTTDEYSNVGLYFDISIFSYQKYRDIFLLDFKTFVDYVKAYCISIFSKNTLNGIENTILDIKHLLDTDYEDICCEMTELKPYSAHRLSDFLSLFITDGNADKLERMICALDAYTDFLSPSGKFFNQRQLADFESYFEFDDIIKDFWNSDISKDDRFFYYPLYIWWTLTAVIPLRPREFLLTERDCLFIDKDGRYNLKLRRNQIKGGHNGSRAYKIAETYFTQPIPIPDSLGHLIEDYIKETDKYEHTNINTLFVTDPHYRKWKQSKHNNSRFLTYYNMNTILRYFFRDIIQNKYGYTVIYDDDCPVDHKQKQIRYIHLGDTRHIAFINMMQEGATPVTAMLLGGHANSEMAGHYYSNIVNYIECKTYQEYRKTLTGSVQYKIGNSKKLPSLASAEILQDGGVCYSENYKNGSIEDCIKVCGANGEIGYCPDCTYYRNKGLSYFSGDDIYKRHIEQDCRDFMLAVQAVMESKGNTENIREAMLKLNSSSYSYKTYLKEKMENERVN